MSYTSYAGEFDDLARAFYTAWNNRAPVAWPNVIYSPPSPPSPWVRFTVLNADAARRTIGNPGLNRATYPGRVIIQCFAPRGEGEVLARTFADDSANIFRILKVSNYRMGLPTVRQVESVVDQLWYQVNADCPFQRDVYHA